MVLNKPENLELCSLTPVYLKASLNDGYLPEITFLIVSWMKSSRLGLFECLLCCLVVRRAACYRWGRRHYLGRFWNALSLLNQAPTRASVTINQLSFFATQQYYYLKNTWSMFRYSTRQCIFNFVVIGWEMSEIFEVTDEGVLTEEAVRHSMHRAVPDSCIAQPSFIVIKSRVIHVVERR